MRILRVGLTLLLTATLCLAAVTGTAETVKTVTVTLNATTGVTGFLYYTDGESHANIIPADVFHTYTAPFTMTSDDCVWIVAVLEYGYSIGQWSTGETANPYRLHQPDQDVTLSVTAAKTAIPAAPTKNGFFQGQAALVKDFALVVSSVNFPDAYFLKQVQKLPAAADGLLTIKEIESIASLDVSGCFIEDLSGVGFFTSLTALNCSANRLAALDVSRNPKLTSLNADNQNVCAPPIEIDGKYQVLLTALPGVEAAKVSNVQGANTVYNPNTGFVILDDSAAPSITYSYDTGLNGSAMNVTVAAPSKSSTGVVGVRFPDAAMYATGESFFVTLDGYVGDVDTDTADFIRETIDAFSSRDEEKPFPIFKPEELLSATFSRQNTIAFHLDDSIAIDPNDLPQLDVWYEGENTFGYPNPLFVPEVKNASWNAETRLLQYEVSVSFNAAFFFVKGNEAGKLAVEEMLKTYFTDLRFNLRNLTIPASKYQPGRAVKLDCTLAVTSLDRFTVTTADGAFDRNKYSSYLVRSKWDNQIPFSTFTPNGQLKIEGLEDPEPNTFTFILTDSNGKLIDQKDHVGAGSLLMNTLYYPQENKAKLNAAFAQVAGSDPAYDYDDSVWQLTFGQAGSAPTYAKSGVYGTEALFTNQYYSYQIAFTTQPKNASLTENDIDYCLNAAAKVSPIDTAPQPQEEAILTWFACDKDGNVTGNPLGKGKQLPLAIGAIPDVEYYRCVATFPNARPVSSRVVTVCRNMAAPVPQTADSTPVALLFMLLALSGCAVCLLKSSLHH